MKFLHVILFISVAAVSFSQEATIIDSRHYSNVFGEIRNFRIFLPKSYSADAHKRYPVIYFFHGWGQRYFGEGSDEYAGYDKGNQNKGDNIANYVAKHNVIVVKADGYNRRSNEEYYRRPYNVLPVETYRQFPIYFPELVNFIDAHYRTLSDRQHRAISGLSMGGFMTFFLAAKYPHMVSSAGSFCGSPEFTIGPIDFPVEYKHMDMYRNFEGINVRLHYGDKDFIRSYHNDMNRMWSQVMDNYKWKIYDAEHSTCGLGEMFDSIMNTFDHPLAKPARWNHTDVYPEFEVWNYHVSSDRTVAGFTILENVDRRGFRSAVREFVPDGQLIGNVRLTVTTEPVYEKNAAYVVNDIDLTNGKSIQTTVQSDQEGRLLIALNGNLHDVGINKKSDKSELALAGFQLQDASWAEHGKEVRIAFQVLNKGLTAAKNVKATVTAFRKNVKMVNGSITFGGIGVNAVKNGNGVVSFVSDVDSIDIIKFRVDLADGSNHWTQFIDVPVKKLVHEIEDIEIADGRRLTVMSSGTETETIELGKGNGDGIANPGESIVVLVKDSGKLWRTDLTFSDKGLNPGGLATRRSDGWSNIDHVGASAKYDEVLIASDYPQNKEAAFFAEYWTPQYPMHIVHQGVVKVKISGKDATPPVIDSIQFRGDNTLEVKVFDGGGVKSVKAKLIKQNEPGKVIELVLKDDGQNGDRTANDHVFSLRIADQKFALYKATVEAIDDSGNRIEKKGDGLFVGY